MNAMEIVQTGRASEASTSVFVLGNLSINLDNYQVHVGGSHVSLGVKEFDLLCEMAKTPDRIVPLDSLLRTAWNDSNRRYVRRLNVMISRLKGKLAGSDPYILTSVRSRGYGLVLRDD